MNQLKRYAKFLAALATAIIIAAQAPISDGTITSGEWIAIVLSALGSGAVLTVENAPKDEYRPEH